MVQGRSKSGKGLSTAMAKDPAVFGRLSDDNKRRVIELAIKYFGVVWLKDQSHIGFKGGGVAKKSKGSADYRKGGMVLSTTDNRKK